MYRVKGGGDGSLRLAGPASLVAATTVVYTMCMALSPRMYVVRSSAVATGDFLWTCVSPGRICCPSVVT